MVFPQEAAPPLLQGGLFILGKQGNGEAARRWPRGATEERGNTAFISGTVKLINEQ